MPVSTGQRLVVSGLVIPLTEIIPVQSEEYRSSVHVDAAADSVVGSVTFGISQAPLKLVIMVL